MTIIYILFFGIINLLIFSQLTKKIELKKDLKIRLIAIVGVLGLIHFLNPFDSAIPNKLFLIFSGFSLALIIMHYASRFSVWTAIQTTNKKRDELVFKLYDFITLYVAYILVFTFQIFALIKN